MKSKIEAVIFDMDGVLIDSEPLWKIAETTVFNQVGIRVSIKEMETTVGLRIDEVVDFWKERFVNCKVSTEIIVDEIIQEMIYLIKQQGKALTGVEQALLFFKGKGLKIGLATSSYTKLLECVLSTLKIEHYFDYTLSAQNVEYGKPHPQVYLETATMLNIKPQNCLVIEDSFNGMLAGLSAKMKVAVIPEKSHSINKKLTLSDFYFTDLIELVEYFKKNDF